MENTGEQFVMDNSPKRLKDEHLARYEYALQFAKGKSVLDIACGTGYGSAMLCDVAERVIGVDSSRECIDYASQKYIRPNLHFIQSRGEEAEFREGQFDLVCSFETIEHLDKKERQIFLDRINQWLKPDGLFLLSTPNKKITSPYSAKPLNKHHVIEFTYKQLENELRGRFQIERRMGQRFIFTFLTYKFVRKAIRLLEVVLKNDFRIYSDKTSPAVSAWANGFFEPRIIFIMLKKNEINKENKN